jgi:hypothetical protein
MKTDKRTETPGQQPKSEAADQLVETTKKPAFELTDEELNKASGGTGKRQH